MTQEKLSPEIQNESQDSVVPEIPDMFEINPIKICSTNKKNEELVVSEVEKVE